MHALRHCRDVPRFTRLDKYNTLYVISFYNIIVMMNLYGHMLFATSGACGRQNSANPSRTLSTPPLCQWLKCRSTHHRP